MVCRAPSMQPMLPGNFEEMPRTRIRVFLSKSRAAGAPNNNLAAH